MSAIPQFGSPMANTHYQDRPGAYAVIKNDLGQMLAVVANNRYHLPGGGIDASESPQQAVEREIQEETGYIVTPIKELGQANQFLNTKDLGPINKLATYYICYIPSKTTPTSKDTDHEVRWIDPLEFLSSTAHDFHKWAVAKTFDLNDVIAMRLSGANSL